MSKDDGTLRSFDSGATRDTSEGKLAYNGFYSPFVMKQFARYMNMNRVQSDGKLRAANNWQKGIPVEAYRESLGRHYQEFWQEVEIADQAGPMGVPRQNEIDLMAAACGMMFNIQGFVLEWLKKNEEVRFDVDEPTDEMQERLDKIKAKERTEDLMFPDVAQEYPKLHKLVKACGIEDDEPYCDECGWQECTCLTDEHLSEAVRKGHESHMIFTCPACDGRHPDGHHPDCHLVPTVPEENCTNCKWYPMPDHTHPCDCCDEDNSHWVEKP